MAAEGIPQDNWGIPRNSLKVGRNMLEFDDFTADNNKSFPPSGYLEQIPFHE